MVNNKASLLASMLIPMAMVFCLCCLLFGFPVKMGRTTQIESKEIAESFEIAKDGDSPFLRSTINSFISYRSDRMDIRTAASMINSLHEKELSIGKENVISMQKELESTKKELQEIKELFSQYKQELMDSDLYRTFDLSVKLSTTRPENWKNKSDLLIASAPKNRLHWLNKWIYISDLGPILVCETNDTENDFTVLVSPDKKEEVSIYKVVLLGPQLISKSGFNEIVENWNSEKALDIR